MAKQEKTSAELYREQRKARLAKAAKKNKKKMLSPQATKRIGKITAVIVVLAIICVIGAVAASYTGIIERNTTVLTINGEQIKQPEFAYYYNNAYSMAYQYANYGYVQYDTSKTPDVQTYGGEMGEIKDFPEDQTAMWTDYFEYYAKNSIQSIKSGVAEAKKLGLELDEDDLAAVQSNIDSTKSNAESGGYSLSAYLRAYYGKGLSEKLFRTILEEQQLYSKLNDTKETELKDALKKKDVEEAFDNGLTTYAVASFRSYTITAETETNEESGASAPTEKTLAAAKKRADAIVAASTSENAFLSAVQKDANANGDDTNYLTDDTATLHEDVSYSDAQSAVSDTDFLTALFTKDAQKNVAKLIESDTGYTVAYVLEGAHKPGETLTYDVRHILVKFPEAQADETTDESADEAADAEAAEEATTEAAAEEITVEPLTKEEMGDVTVVLDVDGDSATDKATYQKAQNILKEYLAGEHTEDAFAALAKKYSEDSNASDGGIYTDVPTGQMVAPFESWALDADRKEGDVGIVETEYGYHIMYFVKTNATPWDDQIRTDLVATDLNDYLQGLADSEDFTVNVENQKGIDKVEESIVRLARNQIRNAANSANTAN
ncbi:MAG: peptidyl-prolyl cis-trans isomerase [Clostridia bacterium]|nr:peptidyl-prolyl cis-trans isomerase [Clostridia bacterium]